MVEVELTTIGHEEELLGTQERELEKVAVSNAEI